MIYEITEIVTIVRVAALQCVIDDVRLLCETGRVDFDPFNLTRIRYSYSYTHILFILLIDL
jgi:hypothetical protein